MAERKTAGGALEMSNLIENKFRDLFLREISQFWIDVVIKQMNDPEIAKKTRNMLPSVFSGNCTVEELKKFEEMFFLDSHTANCAGCHWKLYNSLADISIFNMELNSDHERLIKRALKAAEHERALRKGWAMSRIAFRYMLIGQDDKAEEVIVNALNLVPELLNEISFPFFGNNVPRMVESMIPAVISMGLLKILCNKDHAKQEAVLENLKSYFTEVERDRYWFIDALTFEKCKELSEEKLETMIIFLLKRYKFTGLNNTKEFFINELDWIADHPNNDPGFRPGSIKKGYGPNGYGSRKYIYKYEGD